MPSISPVNRFLNSGTSNIPRSIWRSLQVDHYRAGPTATRGRLRLAGPPGPLLSPHSHHSTLWILRSRCPRPNLRRRLQVLALRLPSSSHLLTVWKRIDAQL
jgi:hypothetical protein